MVAIALKRQSILVSDDLDVRDAADELGVPTTGTAGILILCARRGYVSRQEANALLTEMRRPGYRSPVSSLDARLNGS